MMKIYDTEKCKIVDISAIFDKQSKERMGFEEDSSCIDSKIKAMMARFSGRKTKLLFHHNWGGGADSYIQNFISKANKEDVFFVVQYISVTDTYLIKLISSDLQFEFELFNMDDILSFFEKIKIKKIYINELTCYKDIYYSLNSIVELKKKANARLIMLLHDFFCICPTITLTTVEGEFCNLQDVKSCKTCRSYKFYRDYKSIEKWRNGWGIFLEECDEIIAFSNNSIEIFTKIFGKDFNIILRPHKVDYINKISRWDKTTPTINIGFLGAISVIKGLNIIKEISEIIRNERRNVRLKLIGHCVPSIIEDEYFFQTGRYRVEEIGDLALENDVDIFFIPSVWPETFSYTTEEAIQLGMPVACFNIGAPSERVINYENGLIISEIDAKIALEEIVHYVTSKRIDYC